MATQDYTQKRPSIKNLSKAKDYLTKRIIESVAKMTEDQKAWFLTILEEVSLLKTRDQMIAYLETKTPNPEQFTASLSRLTF